MGVYIQDIDMPKQDEILQIRIYGDRKVSRVYDIKCQQIGTAIQNGELVSVVRCKDCKWWHSNTEFCSIWSYPNVAQRTLRHDYCSRGERRREGEVEE